MVIARPDSINRSVRSGPIRTAWWPEGQISVFGSTAAGVGRAYSGFVRCRRIGQNLRPTHSYFDPRTRSQSSSGPDHARSLRILERCLPETQTGIAAKVSETRVAVVFEVISNRIEERRNTPHSAFG